jgi:hypothetical protein
MFVLAKRYRTNGSDHLYIGTGFSFENSWLGFLSRALLRFVDRLVLMLTGENFADAVERINF